MDTDDCMNRNSLTEEIKLSSSSNYPGTCMQKETFPLLLKIIIKPFSSLVKMELFVNKNDFLTIALVLVTSAFLSKQVMFLCRLVTSNGGHIYGTT